MIRYGGSERDVGVATNFRGRDHCWGLMTCVLVPVLCTSRFRRPTWDGVLLPKILMRNWTGVRFVTGPKSVLVVDLKFGLGTCLDIRCVCLARSILGQRPPFLICIGLWESFIYYYYYYYYYYYRRLLSQVFSPWYFS
jgi:hypothetical protein